MEDRIFVSFFRACCKCCIRLVCHHVGSKYVNVVSSSFNHDEKSIEREDLLKLIIKEKQGLNNNFHELQNVSIDHSNREDYVRPFRSTVSFLQIFLVIRLE